MDYTTYLVHHGIKGMKWGVRRYQNPDGTLTEAGKKRYQKRYFKRDGALTPEGVKRYAHIDTRLPANELISDARRVEQEIKDGLIPPTANVREATALKINNALAKMENRYSLDPNEQGTQLRELKEILRTNVKNLLSDDARSWDKVEKYWTAYERYLQMKLSDLNFDNNYTVIVDIISDGWDQEVRPHPEVVPKTSARYKDRYSKNGNKGRVVHL